MAPRRLEPGTTGWVIAITVPLGEDGRVLRTRSDGPIAAVLAIPSPRKETRAHPWAWHALARQRDHQDPAAGGIAVAYAAAWLTATRVTSLASLGVGLSKRRIPFKRSLWVGLENMRRAEIPPPPPSRRPIRGTRSERPTATVSMKLCRFRCLGRPLREASRSRVVKPG
jgi:hypothetical protein